MTTITEATEHAKIMRRWLNGPANDQTEDELFRDLDETLGHLEVLLDMVTKCTCGSYDTKIIEIRKHCRDCERDMVRQAKEEMAKVEGVCPFCRRPWAEHEGVPDKPTCPDMAREPCPHRRDRGNEDVEHYVCDLTRDKPCPDDMHDTCPGRVEDE